MNNDTTDPNGTARTPDGTNDPKAADNTTDARVVQDMEAEHDAPEMITGRDRQKRVLRVGLFSLIGLIILVLGVFVIGSKKNLFSSTFSIYTNFKTVEGLKNGALVMINGINIGTVSNIALMMEDTSSYVRVDMTIDGDYRKFVRSNTIAAVAQQGLIGDKLIELHPGAPTAPIVHNGDSIPAALPVNYLAILDEARNAVKNTENITSSLDTLFLRFRRGEGTLGKFLTDDEAYNGLVRVTNSAQTLFQETGKTLNDVSVTLNRASGNVDAMTVEAKNLVSDVSHGKGTVGALLYDRSLYDSLTSLTGTLTQTASSAGMAAQEFGINMRGLRSNWLVGGLFSGGEEKEKDLVSQSKLIEIRMQELERQKKLLDQRERELMQKETSIK